MPVTILIADDHAGFRTSARALLESSGYVVVGEAETGAQAISETARLSPDVLLLDVQLPDADGIAIAQRILELPAGPLVILTSGRTRSDIGGRLDRAGACGFIHKPDLSRSAIEGLLANRPRREPPQ